MWGMAALHIELREVSCSFILEIRLDLQLRAAMMIVAMPIIETVNAMVIKQNIFLPATVVQWTRLQEVRFSHSICFILI